MSESDTISSRNFTALPLNPTITLSIFSGKKRSDEVDKCG